MYFKSLPSSFPVLSAAPCRRHPSTALRTSNFVRMRSSSSSAPSASCRTARHPSILPRVTHHFVHGVLVLIFSFLFPAPCGLLILVADFRIILSNGLSCLDILLQFARILLGIPIQEAQRELFLVPAPLHHCKHQAKTHPHCLENGSCKFDSVRRLGIACIYNAKGNQALGPRAPGPGPSFFIWGLFCIGAFWL